MKSTIEKALQKQQEKSASAETKASTQIPKDGKKETTPVQADPIKKDAPIKNQSVDQESIAGAKKSKNPKVEANYFEVDIKRLEKDGFVTMSDTRRRINEEYREIKRKLLQNAFGPLSKTLKNSNIIMVTSARPSEGKTFSAVNLALSIAAEQDKTVLLVDADVLKPNVLRTLGLEAQKGLMDYLLDDEAPLSDFIYRTNIDKLRIIPAGSSHHLSTELLASTIMHETVDEFSSRYPDRVVIIDTPPIIGINESAILANFAGQAVMVVEEGRSKLDDIQLSVERLNPDMAVGFVINKSINITEAGGYYGYYYYGSEANKPKD